jgi:RHS repeat-associated protein
VVNQYDYDAWGNVRWGGSNTFEHVENRYLFQGREWDRNGGFYYFRNRIYLPERGEFASPDRNLGRGILGEMDGMGTLVFGGGDPVNKVDPTGLYAFDMHFYAVYVALVKAGKSKDDAWLLAYWSATPDIDPRHGATSGKIIRESLLYGDGSGASVVQQLLHQLSGMKGKDIEKMRCCLRELYKNSDEPVVKGYALHALGDTYGHMVAETVGGVPGFHSFVFTGNTLDKLYQAPVGHTLDFTMTDRASLRPDQAEKYLRDLSSLVGVSEIDTTDLVTDFHKLNPKGTDIAAATANWRKYIQVDGDLAFPNYATGWNPEDKKSLVSTKTVRSMTDWRFEEKFVRPLLDSLLVEGVVWPVPDPLR